MKVLYVTTIGTTMGFFKSFIKKLIDEGHTVDIATNENEAIVPDCYREWGCKIYPLSCTRSPFRFGNIKAVGEIRKLADNNKYDIVHCHTPIAAACTRFACIKARKKGTKVFYTAHGFHFYKGAPLKNWLIYYPVEKICSYFTDTLVTINEEDFELAKRKMRCRIEKIPGVGVDEKRYFPCTQEEKNVIKQELGFDERDKIIMCVGELSDNKNQKMLIKAMKSIANTFPSVKAVFAGVGPNEDRYKELSKELGVENNVIFLGYCTTLEKYQKAADMAVSCSIREGLGLNLVEAMLSENPVVATKNRGHNELVDSGKNGFLIEKGDVEGLSEKIKLILSDLEKAKSMGRKGLEIAMNYTTDISESEMYKIYFNK